MCPLHSYIDGNTNPDPTVVKLMLDLGSGIDVTDLNGNSPLILLLKEPRWLYYGKEIRETLELLIYENPNPYLNNEAVYLGLKQDEYIRTNWNVNLAHMPKRFQMDGRYIRQDYTESFALNFIGSLLIECGFPRTTADILMKGEKLGPNEVAYIQQSIHEPRALKLCCRDSLRRHFRGRCLHQFVEDVVIPNRLKDYILLKDVLLCLDM